MPGTLGVMPITVSKDCLASPGAIILTAFLSDYDYTKESKHILQQYMMTTVKVSTEKLEASLVTWKTLELGPQVYAIHICSSPTTISLGYTNFYTSCSPQVHLNVIF